MQCITCQGECAAVRCNKIYLSHTCWAQDVLGVWCSVHITCLCWSGLGFHISQMHDHNVVLKPCWRQHKEIISFLACDTTCWRYHKGIVSFFVCDIELWRILWKYNFNIYLWYKLLDHTVEVLSLFSVISAIRFCVHAWVWDLHGLLLMIRMMYV